MDNGSHMLITCNKEHTKMPHKTHIHGFKLSLVQENLSSGFLLKFSCSKIRYDTLQKGNSKAAEQSVWMRRLLYAFVVHTSQDSFSCVEDHMGLEVRKPVFGGLRTTQAQTSLPISIVWSTPLLFTFWIVPYLSLLQAKFHFSI